MKKKFLTIILFIVTLTFLSADNIEKILLKGNRRVTRDTIFFYLKSKEGSVYSKVKLRNDFKKLWDTGFFKNIKIDVNPGKDGYIVTIEVEENPFISKLEFKKDSKFKRKEIEEELNKNGISLMSYTYYNPFKIKRAKEIIKLMLEDKGYNDSNVQIKEKFNNNTVELKIVLNKGSRTKIGVVDFPGVNGALDNSYLLRGLKNNKEHGLLSAIGSKDVYLKEKIGEDLEEVELRLKSKGYLEAKVGKPSFSFIKKKGIWLWSKKRKMLKLSIPVELGAQYRVGKVSVEGAKVIKKKYIMEMINKKFKSDDIFSLKKRNKVIEDLRKLYGSLGYFYCQVIPEENLNPETKIADLVFKIVEGDVVYLGKLEFIGNTYTKDHVIRREFFLREGYRLNSNLLESSLRRMKQLGLVEVEEMPKFKPDPTDPQKMDIKVKVKEINRQMVNFNVGYSGYDGWFIAAGYSTQNFLGQGESLGINLQTGSRAKNYRIFFTEPYIFNTNATLGIDVFKASYKYPYMYTRDSKGFSITGSFRFWRYFGASLRYGYEDVDITDVDPDWQASNSYYYYYYTEGQRVISSLSPTISYNTVDSPIFPTSGVKYLFSYRYSGGFLGGSVKMHKFKLEFVKFIPVIKKHVFGIRAVYRYITSFGNTTLPYYERIYLGGEQNIRGYDIYQLGPRNERGYVYGGNKATFINLEYRVPLNEMFSLAMFYDMGNSYDIGRKLDLNDVYTSMGLEFKVFVPALNVPFRLIFAYNPRKLHRDSDNWVFRFAIGPSFY